MLPSTHILRCRDVALLTAEKGKLKALLLKRTQHPGRGKWALPGTFVGFKESLENAAQRALAEKTGVAGVFLEGSLCGVFE